MSREFVTQIEYTVYLDYFVETNKGVNMSKSHEAHFENVKSEKAQKREETAYFDKILVPYKNATRSYSFATVDLINPTPSHTHK